MMKAEDFIFRVRFDYNDIDADRIEEPLIIDYLNEAVEEIFKLNPAKFIKPLASETIPAEKRIHVVIVKWQFLDNVLLKEQIRQAAIRGVSQNVGKK